MKIKRILLVALLIAVPIFAWYLLENRKDLNIIFDQWGNLNVLAAFALSSAILIAAHLVRAFKTRLLTNTIKVTSLRTHTRALFIGYLFNALLPIRIGEFIRAYVLGKGIRMSGTFMLGLVLFDRALDGIILGSLTLLLLLTTSIFDAPHLHHLILFAAIILLAVALLVLGLLLAIRAQPAWLLRFWYRFTSLFNDDLRDSTRFRMWSLMYGLERVFITDRIIKYIGISLAMWFMYILAIVPLALAFLSHPSASQLAATSTISYLGVSVPAGPAHIGSYQAFVQPFIDSHHEITNLQSMLAIAWILQILPSFVVGLIFVIRTQETFKKPAVSKSLQAIDDKLLRDVDITHDLGPFLEAFFTNNSLSRIMHRLEVDKQSKLIHYFKGGSNAVTALVHENSKFLVRKITPIQYKYKLQSQYEWLKDKGRLGNIVNVIGEETTDSYYKIDLEYSEQYIPFFDYLHSMPLAKSKKIISEAFDYLFKNVYKPERLKFRPADLDAYIEDRCLSKIRQAAEVNDEIRRLLTYDRLIINGVSYKNIPLIIDEIKKNKGLQRILATYRKCSIHGDTTVDNILASKEDDSYLLIDPTDNENEISGPVFDFGRMSQSLVYGYEFLARDDRKVDIADNRLEFESSLSSNYAELAKHLKKLEKKYLSAEEQRAVLFHAAVLYSRMLTHRVVINPLNAVKFYAVSVIAFNNFMKQAAK
jgi:uncharacterized protein (TIRG00374 family)